MGSREERPGGDWWEPPMPSTDQPWQTLDEVVETCEWVVTRAKSVRVSARAVNSCARELLADGTVNLIAGELPVFDSGGRPLPLPIFGPRVLPFTIRSPD